MKLNAKIFNNLIFLLLLVSPIYVNHGAKATDFQAIQANQLPQLVETKKGDYYLRSSEKGTRCYVMGKEANLYKISHFTLGTYNQNTHILNFHFTKVSKNEIVSYYYTYNTQSGTLAGDSSNNKNAGDTGANNTKNFIKALTNDKAFKELFGL